METHLSLLWGFRPVAAVHSPSAMQRRSKEVQGELCPAARKLPLLEALIRSPRAHAPIGTQFHHRCLGETVPDSERQKSLMWTALDVHIVLSPYFWYSEQTLYLTGDQDRLYFSGRGFSSRGRW